MASNSIHHIAGKIFWRLDVLYLWLGDKPSEERGSVTHLVLQVYFPDHTASLGKAIMDTLSPMTNYHSDCRIGSTFQICSPISHLSITQLCCLLIHDYCHAKCN